MSQSLTKLYVHIVFSTKHRSRVLVPEIQPALFAYFGGICNNLECYPIKIGGYIDHIHILCMLSKKITLISLLQEIKTGTSKWIKTQGKQFSEFHWQDGYGAFSVNPSQINIVADYISKQNEHHKKGTFQDEYRNFLEEYKVDYDERYVWD
ncbi:MAG: IS200/IS605 family transposase [Bacteroidales bacterium]|jgi:REP element-mobilizing transposase RayT